MWQLHFLSWFSQRSTVADYLQIVVGVTKAVGERFGKGGIADRMIWFNGFPYLDNKEEHSFGVPVSKVMASRDRLTVLPASGATLSQVERILSNSDFQGFPIVQDYDSNNLVGYVGKTELRYAVERAKRDSFVPPEAICVFAARDSATASAPSTPAAPAYNINPALNEHSDTIPDAASQPHLDFSRFPDYTPLSVHPGLPLETVMELFKKLGPRVILVEYRGALAGLVTVKDCLKYQFTAEADEHSRENDRLAAGEEVLWGVIRHTASWIQRTVKGWSRGRIVLNEPGEGAERASSIGHFDHGEGTGGGVRGRDGLSIADPGLELEERFQGGGTGSG